MGRVSHDRLPELFTYDEVTGLFRRRVGRGSRTVLGTFDTVAEAGAAVRVALRERHGEFAR